MKEISDELFEYLFTKIFREGEKERLFLNLQDNCVVLVELKNGGQYFVNSGKIEEDSEGNLISEKTDKMLFVRDMKNLKAAAIPREYVKKILERVKLEDFVSEVGGFYNEIIKENGGYDEKRSGREENRRIFGKLLEEAAAIEMELSRRKNEDVWGYAKRLSEDRASYEKREAAKLIKRCDEEISELWHRLRYNTDEKHRILTERCIDSIIRKCLRSIDGLSANLLNRAE